MVLTEHAFYMEMPADRAGKYAMMQNKKSILPIHKYYSQNIQLIYNLSIDKLS